LDWTPGGGVQWIAIVEAENGRGKGSGSYEPGIEWSGPLCRRDVVEFVGKMGEYRCGSGRVVLRVQVHVNGRPEL
jgi:hypothetical protein